jgi:hypothetical protein
VKVCWRALYLIFWVAARHLTNVCDSFPHICFFTYIFVIVVCLLWRSMNCDASKLVLGVVLEAYVRSWHMKYAGAINLAERAGCLGWSGREPNAKRDRVCYGGKGEMENAHWGRRVSVKATALPSTPTYPYCRVCVCVCVCGILLYRHICFNILSDTLPNTDISPGISILMISCYHVNRMLL